MNLGMAQDLTSGRAGVHHKCGTKPFLERVQ